MVQTQTREISAETGALILSNVAASANLMLRAQSASGEAVEVILTEDQWIAAQVAAADVVYADRTPCRLTALDLSGMSREELESAIQQKQMALYNVAELVESLMGLTSDMTGIHRALADAAEALSIGSAKGSGL